MFKLFGIGTPKTGTVSLRDYFQSIGLRVLHNHDLAQEIIQTFRQGKEHPALSEFDIFFDAPFSEVAEQILKKSPQNQLLYHWRDCETFVNSVLIHVADHRVNHQPHAWTEVSTAELRERWKIAHNTYYEMKDKYPDRVHKLKVGDKPQWALLCQQLNISHKQLPHRHSSADRILNIYQACASLRNDSESPIVLGVRTYNDWKNRRHANNWAQSGQLKQKQREWWKQTFSMPYEDYRHSLSCIARENWARIEGLDSIVNLQTWKHQLFPEAILIPIDDDDWLHPQLLPQIRASLDHSTHAICWQADRLFCTKTQAYQSHPWGSRKVFNTNGYALLPRYRKYVTSTRMNKSIQDHMRASLDPQENRMLSGVWGVCPQTVGSISFLKKQTSLEQFQQTIKQLIHHHQQPASDQLAIYPKEHASLYQANCELYASVRI